MLSEGEIVGSVAGELVGSLAAGSVAAPIDEVGPTTAGVAGIVTGFNTAADGAVAGTGGNAGAWCVSPPL